MFPTSYYSRLLKSYMAFFKGQYKRKKGNYSSGTLSDFTNAHDGTNNTNIKFSYYRFLRFAGHVLERRGVLFIRMNFKHLSCVNKKLSLGLLLEADPSFDLFKLENNLLEYADQSPPISSFLLKNSSQSYPEKIEQLAFLYDYQKTWQSKFVDYIKVNTQSICIVGNSRRLLTQSHGAVIDANNVVFRFNDFCYKSSFHNNCGSKMDVWVKSPDYAGAIKHDDFNNLWTIISGPDVLFTLSNWSEVLKVIRHGGKVIMPPLSIWKELVERLQAPPTAGLLIIAWLIQILGKPSHLKVAGFQLGQIDIDEQYHHSSPSYKAGKRHNWKGEREILSLWQQQGLFFLDR